MRIYLAFAWKRGINKQFLPLFHLQVFYSEWTNANISLELQFPGASGRHCMLSQYCGDTEDKKERNKVPHYIKKIHSSIRLNWWFFSQSFFCWVLFLDYLQLHDSLDFTFSSVLLLSVLWYWGHIKKSRTSVIPNSQSSLFLVEEVKASFRALHVKEKSKSSDNILLFFWI